MGLLDLFSRKQRRFSSPRRTPGELRVLSLATVQQVLEESARHILNKDLQALHEMFAAGADVYVWDGASRDKRVQASREAYLAMIASEFQKHSLASYEIALDKVLLESEEAWTVETVSQTVLADGKAERNRERVNVQLVDGHALITSLELRLAL